MVANVLILLHGNIKNRL